MSIDATYGYIALAEADRKADIDRAAVAILEQDTYGRGAAMTDEERQTLCKWLRNIDDAEVDSTQEVLERAADEIERLDKALKSANHLLEINRRWVRNSMEGKIKDGRT